MRISDWSSDVCSSDLFADTTDKYAYERKRLAAVKNSQSTDERLQASQLAQQRAAATSLESSLEIARRNLDALNLRAPVTGQLSGFSIQVGQSLQQGERIGQVDSPGRNKLIAGVDEFYLGRVAVGQKATVDWGGKSYPTRVTKIRSAEHTSELQSLMRN